MPLTRNRCVLLSSVRDRNTVHLFHYQPSKDAYLNCNHHILLHRQLVRRPIFRWQVVTNFNLNHAWSWNIHVVYSIYDRVKLPGHQSAQRRVFLLVWTIFSMAVFIFASDLNAFRVQAWKAEEKSWWIRIQMLRRLVSAWYSIPYTNNPYNIPLYTKVSLWRFSHTFYLNGINFSAVLDIFASISLEYSMFRHQGSCYFFL